MFYNKTNNWGYSHTSTTASTSVEKKPTFNVTVKKSRIKLFNDTNGLANAYLDDGEEFEIELFNPTSGRIAAEIMINGILDGSIVLRPGERLYLDRFVSKQKMLTFETYEVDGEGLAATATNGIIVVTFKKEYFPTSPSVPYPNFNTWLTGSNSTTIGNNASFTSNCNTGHITTNYVHSDNTKSFELFDTTSLSVDSFETGRIEEGADSDTRLEYTNGVFSDVLCVCTVKLWPLSLRPTDVKKKKRCNECKAKVRHQDKYCSECGTKM